MSGLFKCNILYPCFLLNRNGFLRVYLLGVPSALNPRPLNESQADILTWKSEAEI